MKWSLYNWRVPDEHSFILLFNTRTGALIRLDPVRHTQTEGDPGLIPEDVAAFFGEHGFLVEDSVDELQLIRDVHESARCDRALFSATIELTEACNFRCAYCYQDHASRHLSDPVVEDRIVRYLVGRMAEVQQVHVNWFGGEPLLRLTTLARMSRRMSREARRIGCTFSQFITTNGYLLSPEAARQLVDLGVEHVQITLDGSEAAHNLFRVTASGEETYHSVLTGCSNAVSAGMRLMVRINLHRRNASTIGDLLADLAAYGLSPANTTLHVVRAVNHGTCSSDVARSLMTTPEFAREWVKSLDLISRKGFGLPSIAPRAYNCTFDLHRTVMIGSDGTVRHCTSSESRLADLSDEGQEVGHTALYEAIKARRPFDDPECRSCACLAMCMGGCAVLRELGQNPCNPERYVIPDLARLTSNQLRSPPSRHQVASEDGA